jgi:hypothetical protein
VAVGNIGATDNNVVGGIGSGLWLSYYSGKRLHMCYFGSLDFSQSELIIYKSGG